MMVMFAEVVTGFMAAYGAYVALAAYATAAGVSLYSGYRANQAAKQSARMQTRASDAAAAAQQAAAKAQSDQLRDQAELAALQAGIEQKKAGVAQEQGEVEAARRSRALAADIGNAYAQWAGNGLLVDGGEDSLGHLLTSNVREAGEDIGIIRTNTQNTVWEHDMNRTSYLMSEQSLRRQAKSALAVGGANAYATRVSGQAQAYATRQAGLTALYGGIGGAVGTLGSMGMTGYMAWGPSAGGVRTMGAAGASKYVDWNYNPLPKTMLA